MFAMTYIPLLTKSLSIISLHKGILWPEGVSIGLGHNIPPGYKLAKAITYPGIIRPGVYFGLLHLCYVIGHTYNLVRFLCNAVHSLNLAALKIVAFLQLPARAFSTTWVVLILALKINILREINFNFTLVGTTT